MHTQEKTEYFFVENGNRVYLQEFDYEYVRNSLLKAMKHFDYERDERARRKEQSKFYSCVVIVDASQENGSYRFDARTINLNDLFFKTEHLRVLLKMRDEIFFSGKNTLKDLPMPPLQALYKEYLLNGNNLPAPISSVPEQNLPKITFTRVEIKEDDVRIDSINESNYPDIKPMKLLDWVDNFEVCNTELTSAIRKNSDSQVSLYHVIKSNSESFNTIFGNLSSELKDIFQLEKGFIGKLFNSGHDVKASNVDLAVARLRKIIDFDSNTYLNALSNFKQIKQEFSEILSDTEHAIASCKFLIEHSTNDDSDFNSVKNNAEIRKNRMEKLRTSNNITQLQLASFEQNYHSNWNKVQEVQTILVPMIINCLITNIGKVDDQTLDVIRNVAIGKIKVQQDESNGTVEE